MGSVRSEVALSERGQATRGSFDRIDLLGLLLLGAAVAWTFVSGSEPGGDPGPMAGAFLLAGAGYAGGRLGARRSVWLVPGGIAAVAALIMIASPSETFSSSAGGGLLSYANARAALFIQAAVAAMMVALWVREAPVRVLAVAAVVAFAVVPVSSRSFGALAAGALVAAMVPFVLRKRLARVGIGLGAAALAVTLGGTIMLATSDPPGEDALSQQVWRTESGRQRLVLWHEALELAGAHPIGGVGPGRFDEVAPTARSDPDLPWAHHDFLQQAAETGFVGFGLLLALFGWGFVRLWTALPARAVLGAAALAALGIQSSVDYILHFPAVVLMGAALVGSAGDRSGTPPSDGPGV